MPPTRVGTRPSFQFWDEPITVDELDVQIDELIDTTTPNFSLDNLSIDSVEQLMRYLDNDLIANAYDLLLSLGAKHGEAEDIIVRLIESRTPSLARKINRYLKGEKVEGIDDKVVKDYYDNEKKKRFLMREERLGLHRPKSDGEKTTSSVNVDDILPIS